MNPVDASRDGAVDAATDTPSTPPDAKTCTPMQPFATGSTDGNATPLMVPAGGVRAGRLQTAQFPTDRMGLGEWRAGDYVLANERIALLVEAARPSAGYDPWGGGIVGIARNDGGRLVDAADFNEIIFGLGRFTLQAETVSVLHDGTDGMPAVVRAVGTLKAIPFIDDFGRTLAPQDYSMVRAAVDYELRPGTQSVDVSVTFDTSAADDDQIITTVLHAFFQGYRMSRFFPNTGFVPTGSDATTPQSNWVGFIDDAAMSYAWQLPMTSQTLSTFVSVSGFDAFRAPQIRLAMCTQTRVPFARLVVGGPGLDGLTQALAAQSGDTLRVLRGTVNEAAGTGAAGVRVHALSMDGTRYITRATTDATGAFTLHVPQGMPVRLGAWRQGDAVPDPVSVGATDTTATIRLAAHGTLRVVATEAGGTTALPVRVQVFPATGMPPQVPANWGENLPGDGRLHLAFPTNGDVSLPTPPGRWRVVVSRGPEYDLLDTTVDVRANETTMVPASLRRVVDTTGALCGDFHIHTHRSPDSEDTAQFKIATAVGDGLEILARSEHEYVAEWQSMVRDMNLQRWAFGLTSLELTTFVWGHFGVFPLEVNRDRPNGGNFEWAGRLPPAVFDEVRRRPEHPTIVINHPRSGLPGGSYFDYAQYNPMTGQANMAAWDTNFTAVEFFNDSSFEQNATLVRDWYSFLDRGRRVFAVGSSDSHHVVKGSPVGYPRTCLYLGSDDPQTATPAAVGTAVGTGRSTVFGGIYVDVQALPGSGTGTPVGPGQELTGAGTEAIVRVRVQAAPWVTAQRLRVIVHGVEQPVIALDDTTRDPTNRAIRFQRDIRVPVPADGTYVIVAAQGGELQPVFPGRAAFGVSNPIFLRR